jgi:hypothetical protein
VVAEAAGGVGGMRPRRSVINRDNGDEDRVRVSYYQGGTTPTRLEGVSGPKTGGGVAVRRPATSPVVGEAGGRTTPKINEEATGDSDSDSESESADKPHGGQQRSCAHQVRDP